MNKIGSRDRIAFLVVPSASHRMDAKIVKDRFPSLRVVAPPGVAREGVLSVQSEGGTTLVFKDAVGGAAAGL